jgi:cysteine desulfurase
LRLSLGWSSTEAEVDRALEVIPPAVERLRRFSGSAATSTTSSATT